MGWQAARPCADTGEPDNGMRSYRRGAAEIPAGVSVTVHEIEKGGRFVDE